VRSTLPWHLKPILAVLHSVRTSLLALASFWRYRKLCHSGPASLIRQFSIGFFSMRRLWMCSQMQLKYESPQFRIEHARDTLVLNPPETGVWAISRAGYFVSPHR
jgi:hypothetical protein